MESRSLFGGTAFRLVIPFVLEAKARVSQAFKELPASAWVVAVSCKLY